MSEDEPVDLAAVAIDAEAIDDALAAFEDACSQLTGAAESAAVRPHVRTHLSAVRDRLAEVSVPVTSATADALVVSAADARAALQRVLMLRDVEDDMPDDIAGTEDESTEAEAEADDDAAPEDDDAGAAPEAVDPPPAPPGYRTSTSLPTRNLPDVLVFEGDRWQRAAIVFAADDTLMVRAARPRSGPGRRLDQYRPAQIAQPHART